MKVFGGKIDYSAVIDRGFVFPDPIHLYQRYIRLRFSTEQTLFACFYLTGNICFGMIMSGMK